MGLPAGEVVGAAHLDGVTFALVASTADRRLFARADEKAGWVAAGPALRPLEQPTALARLGTELYLAAGGGGHGSLHRLRFADRPWERLSQAPDVPYSVIAKTGSELLAATEGPSGALLASSDRGATWVRRSRTLGGLFAGPIRKLVASPAATRQFATGDPRLGFGGLYFSDDDGATWTASPLKGDVQALDASGPYAMVDVAVDGPHRSDDYGGSWASIPLGSTRAFLLSGRRAFAGAKQGVRVSDDAGRTWRDSSAGLPQDAEVRGLCAAGKTLIALLPGRVFVATVEQ